MKTPGYTIIYQYADTGRGNTPGVVQAKGEAKARKEVAYYLGFLPKKHRAQAIKKIWEPLDQWGTVEVRMEEIAEDLVREGKAEWEDFDDLDTEAVLTVTMNPKKAGTATSFRMTPRRRTVLAVVSNAWADGKRDSYVYGAPDLKAARETAAAGLIKETRRDRMGTTTTVYYKLTPKGLALVKREGIGDAGMTGNPKKMLGRPVKKKRTTTSPKKTTKAKKERVKLTAYPNNPPGQRAFAVQLLGDDGKWKDSDIFLGLWQEKGAT